MFIFYNDDNFENFLWIKIEDIIDYLNIKISDIEKEINKLKSKNLTDVDNIDLEVDKDDKESSDNDSSLQFYNEITPIAKLNVKIKNNIDINNDKNILSTLDEKLQLLKNIIKNNNEFIKTFEDTKYLNHSLEFANKEILNEIKKVENKIQELINMM
ncbi:hypothetical protein KAZ01_00155 [Candidatus Gracilibacteria bacterium]|nr:hypothetical protein [Candidatus Gracilibacteria bacterium]